MQPKLHPALRTSTTFSKVAEERDNLREMILSLGNKWHVMKIKLLIINLP